MAGAACKVIINNGTAALSQGMERALTLPMVRAAITDKTADSLLDRLVHIDLQAVDGQPYGLTPDVNLLSVLDELVQLGVVTDEVWRLYARPTP